MAGVLVPVIVHLWNDRRGKVLPVGSVALMKSASRKLAWSRRLVQPLLLAVRCLLVMALAGLLAGPYFFLPDEGKGWVLVAGHSPSADSLIQLGYERHAMDSAANYWDEFRRMDSMASPGKKFFVFTPGLLNRFAGERPVTRREVDWRPYGMVDSVNRWTEGVFRVSADSIMVLRAMSRSTGTVFHGERIASRTVSYEGLVADTAAITVMVKGATMQDEKYLRAALKALGDYTGRRLRLVRSGAAHSIAWQPEWDDAVWEGRLPVVLWKLLDTGNVAATRPPGVNDSAGMRDRRVIDPEQVAPVRLHEGRQGVVVAATGVGPGKRVDLRPAFWMVVFLLFLVERLMVFRNDKA